MKLAAMALLAVLGWLATSMAWAQAPAPAARPPDAIDQARGRALQPVPRLQAPPAPAERWVPERRVFLPALGREVIVPGHYEQRISDEQVSVPTLPAYPAGGQGQTLQIPGGDRPPVDLRQGP
jgi:hypothetical protein